MKYKFDHDYHIHSQLSLCSGDPEQNNERILQYARDNGLERICLTDHFWDAKIPGAPGWYRQQGFDHISLAKPLPRDDKVEFLFGCETEYDRNCTVATAKETFDEFDFIIIPTTHLHMVGLTITADDATAPDTNQRRARLWVSRMDALLAQDLPFCKIGIAHLACGLFNNKSREDYLNTLDLIPSEEMERVFAKVAETGVGLELNASDMNFRDGEAERVLRMFRIAKSCGCKFYCGSDAHTPKGFVAIKTIFERAIDMLDLQESDKFHIVR